MLHHNVGKLAITPHTYMTKILQVLLHTLSLHTNEQPTVTEILLWPHAIHLTRSNHAIQIGENLVQSISQLYFSPGARESRT